MGTRRREALRRGARVVGEVAIALVAAELAWRAVAPDPLAPPVIRERDGSEVPLSTIATYLGRGSDPRDTPGPDSALAPGLDLRFCYDGRVLDYFDDEGCIPVRTNSLGFRDEEFTVEKPPGTVRVLAIGDSFTFGAGVLAEDVWVERLEDLLEERVGPAQVVNGGFAAGAHGVGGYAPWLASDGLGFDPDLVLVALVLNDVGPFPMAVPQPELAPEQRWLFGASRLLDLFQGQRARAEFERVDLPDGGPLLELAPEQWNQAKADLVTMRDLCAEHETAFLVAIFPMFFRLERDRYPYHGVHAAVRAFCEQQGIATVDLYPTFADEDARPLWVHPTDQHANPVGQRRIAQALLEPVLDALRAAR